MNVFLFATLLALLAPVATVMAQTPYDLSALEPGQLILNLSATEQVEADQDTLIATLEYTAQGRDKAALQNEVNQAIRDALAILEEAREVEYSTRQYHVFIYQPGRPARSDIENPVWRAQQSLQLTSKDSGELLELAGELQSAGLHITSMYYTLSPEKREEIADSLTADALRKLQVKTGDAAAALNKSAAELIEVDISSNQNVFYPRATTARFSAADAEALAVDPPQAEPGRTMVTVSVSARALLSP